MNTVLLAGALAVFSAISSYAQGSIMFGNTFLTRAMWESSRGVWEYVPADAPIVYGVLWGTAADRLVLNDGPLGTPHQTSPGMIVAPNPYLISGAEPGSTVFMKIAGWGSSFGRDAAAASRHIWGGYGETSVRQITLAPTMGPGTPIWSTFDTTKFQPLRLPLIPEPSALAIAALGLGAFVLARIRRTSIRQ